MSQSTTKTIQGFKNGMYMSWYVTTQAANKITVKLYDDTGYVYFCKSKCSTDIEPPLAQGAATIVGNTVKIEITSSGKDPISVWMNNQDILCQTS